VAWGRGGGEGEGCMKMVWIAGKNLRGRGGLAFSVFEEGGRFY
jgi:hypothetical protein